MPDEPIYEITATIDIAPRPHARTNFSKRVRSGRGLRASLRVLHADGYSTTVRMPSGVVFPGTMFASHDLMDDDTGYGPKPAYEHLVHMVEGTWMLRADPATE